jgi:hypothetical protein
MNHEGAKDIQSLHKKLSARYLHPIVRQRPKSDPPYITITDGGYTNFTIERGHGPFGWKVSGEIQGKSVEFSAPGDRELIRKIDEELRVARVRNIFLGIGDNDG